MLPRSKLFLALVGSGLIASCSAANPDVSASTPVAPEPVAPTFDTFAPPNVQFPVTTTAGTCPDTVDLWELGLGFEGGADHTVVVDFPAMATGPTEILHSEDRRIIYVAPCAKSLPIVLAPPPPKPWPCIPSTSETARFTSTSISPVAMAPTPSAMPICRSIGPTSTGAPRNRPTCYPSRSRALVQDG